MAFRQPDPMDSIRALIDAARRRLMQLIPPPPKGGVDQRSDLIRSTHAEVVAAFASLDDAQRFASDGAVAAIDALDDDQLVEGVKAERSDNLAARAQRDADAALADAESRLDRLRASLKAAQLPARPGESDAAQEAALANLRADLKMVFDGERPEALPRAMAAELGERVAAGDDLAAWFIAASGWAETYMRARKVDGQTAATFGDFVDVELAQVDRGDGQVARRVWQEIDGREGLAAAVLGARMITKHAFADLRRRRPNPSPTVNLEGTNR